MARIVIGVPFLNNDQGLQDLVRSIDVEYATLVVVDNSEDQRAERLIREEMNRTPLPVWWATLPRKGSVAASWNAIAGAYLSARVLTDPLIISNDDVVFHPGTLQSMINFHHAHPDYAVALSTAQWSCFLWDLPFCLERVGLFDEAFHPAYFEDCDYSYRLCLAGIPQLECDFPVTHQGSQTIGKYREDEMEVKHHRHFRRNRAYYRSKWGGVNGAETYTRPFEDAYWES